MENFLKGAVILLVVFPMLLMAVVAVISTILVISDIPIRNRER